MSDRERELSLELLNDIEAKDFAADMDKPHVLVIVDRHLNNVQVSGPFPDFGAATARLLLVETDLAELSDLEFYITPLEKP